MHQDISEILFSEEDIKARVKELGAQIAHDYEGKDLLVVTILRGGAVFMADLARSIEMPLEMDFMAVSSYGSSHKSSGVVRIIKDITNDIEGRHVLIAEDVLDSGLTLSYLMKMLESRKPASVEIACLLHKVGAQKAKVECKYAGFECPDKFIVGYGLDYAERYRNLPYIGVLKPEIYNK